MRLREQLRHESVRYDADLQTKEGQSKRCGVEDCQAVVLAHPRPCGRARKQIAKLRDSAPISMTPDRSETQLQLSRKALVNSALLSFDETSAGPATNSIIDF